MLTFVRSFALSFYLLFWQNVHPSCQIHCVFYISRDTRFFGSSELEHKRQMDIEWWIEFRTTRTIWLCQRARSLNVRIITVQPSEVFADFLPKNSQTPNANVYYICCMHGACLPLLVHRKYAEKAATATVAIATAAAMRRNQSGWIFRRCARAERTWTMWRKQHENSMNILNTRKSLHQLEKHSKTIDMCIKTRSMCSRFSIFFFCKRKRVWHARNGAASIKSCVHYCCWIHRLCGGGNGDDIGNGTDTIR